MVIISPGWFVIHASHTRLTRFQWPADTPIEVLKLVTTVGREVEDGHPVILAVFKCSSSQMRMAIA